MPVSLPEVTTMCQHKVLHFKRCGHRIDTNQIIRCVPMLDEGLYICSTSGPIDEDLDNWCPDCSAKIMEEDKAKK
jgi:DNA-directed RNA polymerase subunit RPC12/RpoP